MVLSGKYFIFSLRIHKGGGAILMELRININNYEKTEKVMLVIWTLAVFSQEIAEFI